MPSSVIQWMRYEPRSRSLLIDFRGGRGLYRYFDVPSSAWEAFRTAPSKGTYLNSVFKDGGYGYERLDSAPIRRGGRADDRYFWGDPDSLGNTEYLERS